MPKATNPPPGPTIKAIASALGITPRRVSQLRLVGLPTDSIQSALDWRKAKSSQGEISVDDLRKARFRLIEEQRRKIEIENAVRRGELVPARDQYEYGLKLGYELKAELSKFMSDVTPQVEGLPCQKIYVVLRDGLYRILTRMSGDAKIASPELTKLVLDFRDQRPEPWVPPNKQKSNP